MEQPFTPRNRSRGAVAAADLEVVEVVVAEEDTVVDEEDLAVAAAVAGQEGDTEVAAAVVDMVTEESAVKS